MSNSPSPWPERRAISLIEPGERPRSLGVAATVAIVLVLIGAAGGFLVLAASSFLGEDPVLAESLDPFVPPERIKQNEALLPAVAVAPAPALAPIRAAKADSVPVSATESKGERPVVIADIVAPLPDRPRTEVIAPVNRDRPMVANPERSSPDVDVAMSELDVRRLEDTLGAAADALKDEPAKLQRAASYADDAATLIAGKTDPIETAAVAQGPKLAPARIAQWVNMRSGPKDEAGIVGVIPADAKVQAETGCQWCLVEHEGTRGYVYKKFLRR